MFYKDRNLFTESEIRALNPNVSFGVPFSPDGYEVVFDTPNPATATQVGIQDGTEIDSKGNRVIKWTVRDKTAEELEAEMKASVPQTITKLQAMKQLKVIDKWNTLKAILASDEDVNDEWVLSDNLNRTYPLVLGMAQALGISDEELDTLFIEASKL